MNKVKRVKFFWLLLVATMSASFFSFHTVRASGVSFGQSILPIKAVYLDSRGEIEKVWTNVSPSDSLYAVKFFDARDEKELLKEQKFLDRYWEYVENQKSCEFIFDGKANKTVEYRKEGRMLEEVQTIV